VIWAFPSAGGESMFRKAFASKAFASRESDSSIGQNWFLLNRGRML
jgi:hypothetical protein